MIAYREILAALIALRSAGRVSQAEIAKRVGHVREDGTGKQSTVSEWEQGKNEMGMDQLVAYAKALGWRLTASLYEEGSTSPEARFMAAIEGLTPGEVASLLEAIEAVIKAPPDARTWAIKLLRSTGSTQP